MKIPIQTLHLFPVLDEKLLVLLKSLSPEQWNARTRAKAWRVKDIAAHLLDGNIRTLSMSRDKYFGERRESIRTYHDLVAYLNQLNADWVNAMKRISPDILIQLLESTGRAYYQHLKSLAPFDEALFSVAWAGEEKSFNWFHIAREYTEKWHHQQQIREAVQQPGIMSKELYAPVLQTFMQALPYHYRTVNAPENTSVKVTITGPSGGSWFIYKELHKMELSRAKYKE